MASLNQVTILGNLTRDVELRHIPSGTAVCELGLAINEKVKRNEQWVDETVFVDVTCFARTAEIAAEYLSKGSPVLIVGRLKLDQWEQDGQKRSKLKVVANELKLLGGPQKPQERTPKQGTAAEPPKVRRQPEPPVEAAVGDEEIPF